MEQTNLFSMFGVEPVEEPKKAGKQVKKETGKAKSSQPKKKGAPSKIKAPVTIYTGYFEPAVLSAEQLGADEVDQDTVLKKACEMFGYPYAMADIDAEGQKAYITVKATCRKAKGIIHLTKDSRMLLGAHQYDISSVMDDEECDLDIPVLQKLVAGETPVFGNQNQISFYVMDNLIIPRSELPEACPGMKFPLHVDILGREHIAITQEEYLSARAEKEKGHDGNTPVKIERGTLIKLVEGRYADFKGHCDLRFNKERLCALVQIRGKDLTVANTAKMIPVVGTTISLIFTQMPLSPEMFGGEEEVAEEEIVRYLGGIYPEYSKERTEIVYDGKRKLVIPILKGSRKGAGIETVISREREEELLGLPACVYEKEISGVTYRVENLPYLYAMLPKGGGGMGTQHYKLPKIPAIYFIQAQEFFRSVSERFDAEAMLQLFWDNEEKRYFLYCPRQAVRHASLSIIRNWELERESWLVMDMHSHGTIGCSFSAVDDEDEKGTRYYGVFYGYKDKSMPKCEFRVGCGGYFLNVGLRDLFEDGDVGECEFDFSGWMDQIECIKGGL